MGVLAGKRGLVMGVANERSIAWGIAKACAEAGAELAFTYQGDAFGKRLEPLAQSVGSDLMVDVDVTDEASLDSAFATSVEVFLSSRSRSTPPLPPCRNAGAGSTSSSTRLPIRTSPS